MYEKTMNIQIKNNNGDELIYKSFIFNGGEVSIKLDQSHPCMKFFVTEEYQIVARIQNSNDILIILNITDALRRIKNLPIHLVLPYCPYARQDRVCDAGESLSLKVFANLINAQGFASVTILDPHSDVVGALFNNIKVVKQSDIIAKWNQLHLRLCEFTLVSPDAGANKKIGEIASICDKSNFIRADKLRDCTNGKILQTIVYGDVPEKVAIIDDIGEGCATFEFLAKELVQKGAKEILLYVTHGLFTRGTEHLYKAGINEIYTTNSYRENIVEENLKVFNIENII